MATILVGSLFTTSQSFSAIWMNALFLSIVYPYTVFEFINTNKDNVYSLDYLKDMPLFEEYDYQVDF